MDKRTRVFNAMDKKPVDHVPVGFWYHFDDAHELARSLGFKHHCTFKERKPEFHKL